MAKIRHSPCNRRPAARARRSERTRVVRRFVRGFFPGKSTRKNKLARCQQRESRIGGGGRGGFRLFARLDRLACPNEGDVAPFIKRKVINFGGSEILIECHITRQPRLTTE
jgi:hypothetical protein